RTSLLAAIALLILAVFAGCARQASSKQVREWDAELAKLQAEQDSLRARANELVQKDPRILALPDGDVVIRIPTSFIRNVLEKVFEDVASHVTLRLGGIKAHVQKKIKKMVTIGEFQVDVDVQEVVGKLGPENPTITFTGGKIGMSLPVSVNRGY